MEHLSEHLRKHVERILRLSGAVAASAYLPSPWPGASDPLLLHAGDSRSIDELADLERARAFHLRHLSSGGHDAATADMRVTPSVTAGAVLLPVPSSGQLTTLPSVPHARGNRQTDHDPVPLAGWLGLRFADADGAHAFGRSDSTDARSVLGLASSLARTFVALHALGSDPLTGLLGRVDLLGAVRRGLQHAATQKRPYSLMLVNPDAFEQLNERYGRPAGDHALREMVVCLQGALRTGDPVMRYGSAVFAVPLPGTGASHALAVAEKARRALSSAAYLAGRKKLSFSVGAATWDPGEASEPDPHQLIRRADVALALAKQGGGGRAEPWSPDAERLDAPRADRLGGVFTGDQDRDYRNLALLWDALTVAWSGGSPAELASRFADQLVSALRPSFVGIYEVADGAVATPLVVRAEVDATLCPDEREHVDTRDLMLLAGVCATSTPRHVQRDDQRVLAVPVKAAGQVIAGLLLLGRAGRLRADASDLTFLEGFAAAMGVAIDRARLLEQERDRSQRERYRLASELKELRTVLREVRLVYNSPAVERVVVDARRVADTDATVLITGESGTGKGLLAQTIHQVSRRRAKPFVIVDCGAIPANLIESELFGYERGAFTGAVTRNPGRIVQADGGTLLLDEVGEIPLEVQAKLLRFVEDHTLTSVGSHQVRRVDVRVLAATNRDLLREVEAGRFRLDLFHRLSVVPLELPALRDRDDDVLMLAKHFLAGFATKYQKPVHQLSRELEVVMQAYRWPGNVRELQNRLLRAVLLADGDTLTPLHMPLHLEGAIAPAAEAPASAASPVWASAPPLMVASSASSHSVPTGTSARSHTPGPLPLHVHGGLPLADALSLAVDAVADAPARARPPLGRWLADDIVLVAMAESDGVARRAATLIGLPETTFSRRLERARRDAGLSARPSYWTTVASAIVHAVRQQREPAMSTNLLDIAEASLIAAIERRLPGDPRAGAVLLGTSTITYRRRTTPQPLAS